MLMKQSKNLDTGGTITITGTMALIIEKIAYV